MWPNIRPHPSTSSGQAPGPLPQELAMSHIFPAGHRGGGLPIKIRKPRTESRNNSEIRTPKAALARGRPAGPWRHPDAQEQTGPDFGFRISFGSRISGFGLRNRPSHLRQDDSTVSSIGRYAAVLIMTTSANFVGNFVEALCRVLGLFDKVRDKVRDKVSESGHNANC